MRLRLQEALSKNFRNVLIIKKIGDPYNTYRFRTVGEFLNEKFNLNIFVEEPEFKSKDCPKFLNFGQINPRNIDLCLSIGGDGTLLHLNSLFKRDCPVPPTLAFSSGTLGFLINFHESEIEEIVKEVIEHVGNFFISRRSRRCVIIKRGSKEIDRYNILNDVVIDKGDSLLAIPLEIYIGQKLLTKTRSDGLIVSTPTGSTAYNLSAGGSVVVPSVSATLLSPICPHTLSFRPIIVPEESLVRVIIPKIAEKDKIFLTFDGQIRHKLSGGDEVLISICQHDFPLITRESDDTFWYKHLKEKLHWNKD